jgi:hypothetical protein
MNRFAKWPAVVTAMLIVALMTSGCATSTLWEEQSCHPADNPNLNLALDPKSRDVLVQYEEQRGEATKCQHRAYWLFASTNSIAIWGKSVFVNPKDYAGLIPIPLLDEAPGTNAPAMSGFVAVATPAQQGFDLWLNGAPLGRFDLPVYFAKPRATVWRVAATPFAALGDTTIIIVVCATVVVVIVGILYVAADNH